MKREQEFQGEQEFQVAATSTPPARLWAGEPGRGGGSVRPHLQPQAGI
jgi:hypothetical protein